MLIPVGQPRNLHRVLSRERAHLFLHVGIEAKDAELGLALRLRDAERLLGLTPVRKLAGDGAEVRAQAVLLALFLESFPFASLSATVPECENTSTF